jgi:phenylpropionate dioxygenase-like ring-hydroxylating dioxygenase large terminal subunit
MAVPVEHRHWHPVALATGVGAAPLAVQLLDQPLVLWRDAVGAVQAWADRCPHRGAALSLGCVRDGQLECPYHGWRFSGSGQVVVVPALAGLHPASQPLRHGLRLRRALRPGVGAAGGRWRG